MDRRGLLKTSNRTYVHFLRSLVASNVSFWLDFGILAFLTEIAGLHYLGSAAIGFAVGTSVNYTLCVVWVFSRRRIRRKTIEYTVFLLIAIVGVGLNEILIWSFTANLDLHYLLSKIVSSSIVFVWNFLTRKYILFR